VLALCDEFPQYGRLAAFETAMKIAAGYGCQLWPFITDLGTLREVYGESYTAFIAAASVRQFFAPQDPFTADYISQLCGTATVVTRSVSQREVSLKEVNGGFTGISSSVAHAQRPLATPDEIMRMHGEQQLIFIDNLPPISARRAPYYATGSTWFTGLFDPDPENPSSRQAPAVSANDNVRAIKQRRA